MDCNDETVFLRVQQGDHDAFGLLVQRYQDRMYSIALKILHHPHDAQDAAQQAFLHVWQKRHAYNPRWRFNTWLYRVVTNICIDEYRRQQRQPSASNISFTHLSSSTSLTQDYVRQECRQVVEAALSRVPVDARMVLVLRYMEGLSYGEIARVRGISVHTVKSQLRRAKARIRQLLESYHEGT